MLSLSTCGELKGIMILTLWLRGRISETVSLSLCSYSNAHKSLSGPDDSPVRENDPSHRGRASSVRLRGSAAGRRHSESRDNLDDGASLSPSPSTYCRIRRYPWTAHRSHSLHPTRRSSSQDASSLPWRLHRSLYKGARGYDAPLLLQDSLPGSCLSAARQSRTPRRQSCLRILQGDEGQAKYPYVAEVQSRWFSSFPQYKSNLRPSISCPSAPSFPVESSVCTVASLRKA